MITNLKDKKILIIVESPSKCAHIKEYLKKEGYTKVVVMASVGHIANLKDNKASYKNTGVYPDQDFKMDFAVTPDKKEVVDRLKEQVKAADLVYLMPDGDREGSQITWSLVKFLNLKPNTYRRIVTHEITPKAVVQAFENPVEIDFNLIESAQARIAIDKIIGYSLSGIARTYIGAKSVGRCQSAGLKLICDREKEIQEFKPETYYDLYLNFEKNGTKFKAKYVGTDEKKIDHLKSEAEVKMIKNVCTGKYIVKDIVEKLQTENPPAPYITATLQQDVAAKLGLKVKDIMSICQKLFEDGKISYHRSDSPVLSDEFVTEAKKYILTNYSSDLYVGQKKVKIDDNAQEGHEAIRCTDITLTPDKAKDIIKNELCLKVYRLIWLRTVQSLLKQATYASQIITITNNGQNFVFNQRVLKDPGFKSIS